MKRHLTFSAKRSQQKNKFNCFNRTLDIRGEAKGRAMDKFQGIFDQGFSGIYEDSNKTLPDYLDILAEQEKDFKPEEFDTPIIPFDKDSSLSRANELTSDGSR